MQIVLVEHDPRWATAYAAEEARLRAALGAALVEVHHVGSTSVPGLAAKPVVDIDLVVRDSADEPAYLPMVEALGYVLRHREPEWHQHRILKSPDQDVNLHVFTVGCVEVRRMLAFRDHLRADRADRTLYQSTKRELASRSWEQVQDYADAKTEVVRAIMGRALAGLDEGPCQRW